jgi:hypothetical protein
MSTDNEMYDQILTDLLNETLKHGFTKAEIITPKKKVYGSRRAIRRVLKARKEKEQSK